MHKQERLNGSFRYRSCSWSVHSLSTKGLVMADAPARRKITINTLNAKMTKGAPSAQLASYDYHTAVISDRLGMDILCVSDTGGMILFGHQSTVTVSFDEVMMMAKAI